MQRRGASGELPVRDREGKMNTQVFAKGGYIVHKYGCCGTFFFFVAHDVSRQIIKRSLLTLDDAIDFIDTLPRKEK